MLSLPDHKIVTRNTAALQRGGCRPAAFFSWGLLFVCCCLLAGCGYGLESRRATVLGDSNVTIKMKSVEHPTLYPWMGQVIRSSLRDELGARKVAVWVDDGPSDYTIQINVVRFTVRSAFEDSKDQTLLYNGNVTLNATVYDGRDNSEVWRSGNVSYSDSFETYSDRSAAEQMSLQAVRLLVYKMRDTF